jgi:WD40 repeat protein
VAVQHYLSDIASVVLCATQRGSLFAYDLRCNKPAFSLRVRPELGSISALTVAPDRHWLAVGTSKSALLLYDIRYQTVTSAWRHSAETPIYRLACCKPPKNLLATAASLGMNNMSNNNNNNSNNNNNNNSSSAISTMPLSPSEGAYLFVAAGCNEAAIFGIPEGFECIKCFRSVSMNQSRQPALPLPQLLPLDIPRLPDQSFSVNNPYSQFHNTNLTQFHQHAVRSMLGRVSAVNPSHLLTAGTDRSIRCWDFSTAQQCFNIAGYEPSQPRAQYRAVGDKLLVCYSPALPSADKIAQSQLPQRENRGLGSVPGNFRDSVLDLKDLEVPQKLLLSSSRDGEIKVWKVHM